ncbi:hypothetical protein [Kribbella turkmenica]|uniref:hypothetical protein n=1 Tax=Kribbella turkmenica TaxID=2530375 RepID=UPI001F1763CD|nr:hypothetical protein [Kribbella turkmenica]
MLFVDEGDVLTSAGAATGLDLCIHMVRKDFGAAVAAETARHIVIPPQRTGDQAQFILHRARRRQWFARADDALAARPRGASR